MQYAPGGRKNNTRGFTLIELLVVIAIIVILAAIMFPVFSMAKTAAKRAVCISNLKQLGTATKMYQDDNNGCYPSYDPYPAPAPWVHSDWVRMLLVTYARTRGIFNCPGAARPFLVQTKPRIKISYAINEYIFYRYHGFYNENVIPSPRFTLLIADGYLNNMIMDWNDAGWYPDHDGLPSGMNRLKYADGPSGGEDSKGNVVGQPRLRHTGPNVLFCDLHVVWIRPERIKAEFYPGPYNSNCREFPLVYPLAKLYQ